MDIGQDSLRGDRGDLERLLFVGDRIGQFRVAAIHPDSTILIGAGRTNLLSLDQ